MDREEMKELSRSLQRVSDGATHHFVWVPAGEGRDACLETSRVSVPTARVQELRRERGASLAVVGTVSARDGAPCFRAERHDHGPFQRHVRQLAAQVPALAGASFEGPVRAPSASGATPRTGSTPAAPAPPPDATPTGAPPTGEIPPILADLLRSVGPPGALRERASRAIRVAGHADRRVERAIGAIIRSGQPTMAGREELDALGVELARVAEDLDADITAVTAALRALDQSLPERVETEEDQARLGKLREAAARLGGVVRTQREARGRVGEAIRILGDLDDTFSASRSGGTEGR